MARNATDISVVAGSSMSVEVGHIVLYVLFCFEI